MATTGSRRVRHLFWLIVAFALIVAGGEWVFTGLLELVDLLIEASQALLITIFEQAFGMSYGKAQGRAAWTSLGLLTVIVLVGVWRLVPWLKARIVAARRHCRESAARMAHRWRAARWYHKLLVMMAGLTVLFGLAMVI